MDFTSNAYELTHENGYKKRKPQKTISLFAAIFFMCCKIVLDNSYINLSGYIDGGSQYSNV